MASLLRRRPIATLCSIFCRQQQRRYRFRSLCRANVAFDVGGQTTSIETGKLAGFTNPAAVITTGDTRVISAVRSSKSTSPFDFSSLSVDYQEHQKPFTLSGNGQAKRETLCSQLIHRPIWPLFPAEFYHTIMVTAIVFSSDRMYDPDVMAANATSASLMLSNVPWNGPIGVIRVGRIEGRFIFNPTVDELSCSDLNLVYACTKDKTLMIDGHGWEITEKDLQTGLKLAHSEALKYIDCQIRLAEEAGRKKGVCKLSMVSHRTLQKIKGIAEASTAAVLNNSTYGESERHKALENITQTAKAKLVKEAGEESLYVLPEAVDMVRNEIIRRRIIDQGLQGLRVDGRQLNEVRPLFCESGMYGSEPGSSNFSIGNTKAECIVGLNTPRRRRRPDWIAGPPHRRLMLHFSVTPIDVPFYSSDEDGYRADLIFREVGPGTLAEKALLAVLPPEDDFPCDVYVTYSMHSTSLAIVCGGSMALMDAGVPVRGHVAGVSVGLVSDVDPSGIITCYRILTDLSDVEDHHGDIDFKITGTRKGITAIQLNIKPAGIPLDIICECLEPARKGRNQILDHMEEKIGAPRTMLGSCDTMALYKRMKGLVNDIARSYEKVRILEKRLEAKDYELRKLELFSQKEA